MAALAEGGGGLVQLVPPLPQCTVITTGAQSAGTQEPNKQNGQTVEGTGPRSRYDLDAGCFQNFTLK